VGNALPKPVLRLIELCEQAARGDVAARHLAEELDNTLRVLSTFDKGPDLVLYYKQPMVLDGHEEYSWHFHETDRLSTSQRDFLESQRRQFKEWWNNWPSVE
jgi:1-pyrroline-4-hydroxy-2-carboxylate deaminase